MERRSSPSIVVLCVVLGLLMSAHQSEADFKSCYKSCFLLCVIKPGSNPLKCGFQCLKDCVIPNSASPDSVGSESFCKLGCSTALCAHISTKANPGEDEVSDCVDSCSGICSKH